MPRQRADLLQTRLPRRALPGGPAFTPIIALVEPLQDNPVPEVRIAAAHLLHLTGGTAHALPIARAALLRERLLLTVSSH